MPGLPFFDKDLLLLSDCTGLDEEEAGAWFLFLNEDRFASFLFLDEDRKPFFISLARS